MSNEGVNSGVGNGYELERIARELNDAAIPQEVWIGTDSTADRITWLITRNKLNQQNARLRHKTIEALADCLEAAMKGNLQLDEAHSALVLAGRRQNTENKHDG